MTRTRPTPEQWERRTEWPLAIAALVFLASYSWLVLQPHAPRPLRHVLIIVDYVTWGVFAVDYLVRVALARDRGRYLLHHLPDLLIVVLPMLRPLRLLRLVALVRILDRWAARSLQGRVATYIVVVATLVVYCGALAELSAERDAAGSNIHTFGTSLWWAVTTVTTVGYGDHYPVTTTGRLVAVALMFAGVALLSAVTATLAAWFVSRVRTAPGSQQASSGEVAALRAELHRLSTDLSEHRRALAATTPASPPGGPTP